LLLDIDDIEKKAFAVPEDNRLVLQVEKVSLVTQTEWLGSLSACLTQNPEVHSVLGEKVACATVSPHLYITSYIKCSVNCPSGSSTLGIRVMELVMS